MPYQPGITVQRRFSAPVMSIVLLIAGQTMSLSGKGLGEPVTRETDAGPAIFYTTGRWPPDNLSSSRFPARRRRLWRLRCRRKRRPP